MIDITRLFIECNKMNYNILIEILNLLPNLDLLKIRLSSTTEVEFFINNENNKKLQQFLNNNKITKLIIENLTEYDEIYFMINSFPRIKYLIIQIADDLLLESVVEYTIYNIKENNHHHQAMTLCIIAYDETYDQIKTLHQMIDSNNLLEDYIIFRQFEKFYIQWK